MIPWGAWEKDNQLELAFPRDWVVETIPFKGAPCIEEAMLESAFSNPVGTDSLAVIAKGKEKVAIAVEDMTRPSVLEPVLVKIILQLMQAGIKKEQIKFIICCGAHAPMNRQELKKKLGAAILKDFLIIQHNAYDNICKTSVVLGKTPVMINRDYMEADCKILVGSIIPHSFAGFSSGGKLILPGLSDIATLERTHKYVMMGFRGGIDDVETNKFRSELEQVAQSIGVDFFCGVVPNAHRKIAGIFAGDVIHAHRKGVEFARSIYHTKAETAADIVVLNAYPKDTELLQADTAMTPLKTSDASIVKPDGTVVVISKCTNGYGYHSLFGPGMRLSRKPSKRGMLKGRQLIVFSPGVNTQEFSSLYWDGYSFADTWEQVISQLKQIHNNPCRVSIFPYAPLQLTEKIHADTSIS